MSLGKELRELREAARYSLEEAAKRGFRSFAPVHVRRVEDFESGGARPTRTVLKSLLAVYHVEPAGQEQYLESYRVALRLKRRASETGLTLKHVAAKVGVDRTNLSKFFNGSRLIRKPEVLLKIATALEMTEDEKRKLLREAGFESFHLELEGDYYGDLAAQLLHQLRRGVGPDRHPRTEDGEVEVERAAEIVAQGELKGATEIVAAASELIRSQLPGSGPTDSIRISVADLSMALDESVQPLAKALRAAVERGVSLQLLLPLGREPAEIVATIVGCLQYLGQPGRFEIRWFDPASTVPPLSLMILPGDTVLLFVPDTSRGRPERAVLITESKRSFVRHFDRRFEKATPLLKLYDSTRSGPDELLRGLRAAEADSEVVLVVKRRMTTHTMPEELWELELRHLEQHGARGLIKPNDPLRYERFSIGPVAHGDRAAILQRLKSENRRRLEGHLRNLEHGSVREIYLREYLEELLRYPSEIYPRQARIAIIDHLLGWLRTYPRYHIGLATGGGLTESPLFGVHNQETVFVSVWRQEGAQYLEVKQPVIARIFQQYFMRLWPELPNTERPDVGGEGEKDGVTSWLEGLKKEIAQSESGQV